jgi:hypothetical protein
MTARFHTTQGGAYIDAGQHRVTLMSDADLCDMDAEDALLFGPRRIRTRPGYAARSIRWVRCAWLRWQIRSTERYIAACVADGILDGLSMREFRRQLDAMRVRLAMLETT